MVEIMFFIQTLFFSKQVLHKDSLKHHSRHDKMTYHGLSYLSSCVVLNQLEPIVDNRRPKITDFECPKSDIFLPQKLHFFAALFSETKNTTLLVKKLYCSNQANHSSIVEKKQLFVITLFYCVEKDI